MNLTSAFQLPRADPTDTGALALYLKDLATNIDTKLQSQLDEMNEFMTPLYRIVTNSSSSSITPGFNFIPGSTVVSTNYPLGASELPKSGWWHIGASIIMGAGATNNAAYTMRLWAFAEGVVPGEQVTLGEWSERENESSTSGNGLNLTQEVYVPPEAFQAGMSVSINNSSASTLSVAANCAYQWAVWLGYGDVNRRVIF